MFGPEYVAITASLPALALGGGGVADPRSTNIAKTGMDHPRRKMKANDTNITITLFAKIFRNHINPVLVGFSLRKFLQVQYE